METGFVRGMLVSSIAVTTAICATSARAQVNQVEEIVVTAQKLTTTLSRTPAALAVVSGDQLRDRGVSDVQGVVEQVAGVQMLSIGPVANLSIRGIGSTQFAPQGGPAVGTSYAGVPIESSLSLNSATFDLERVEVLKGPQGTLYGLNATAGVLNIIPRAPTLEQYEGLASLQVGNYDAVRVEAAANVPLGDTAALRVAGMVNRHDGYFSNGYNDADDKAVRGQLLWKPSPGFSVLFASDYLNKGGRGGSDAPLPLGRLGTDASDPNTQSFAPDSDEAYQDNDFWGVHAEVKADLGFANLTLIPAYRENLVDTVVFRTGFRSYQVEAAQQKSVEARLDGESGRLSWLAGAYLFEGERDADYVTTLATGVTCTSTSTATGVLTSFYQAGCYTLSGVDAHTVTKSKSTFAKLTYEIAPELKLSGGIRYSEDGRELRQISWRYKSGTAGNAQYLSGPIPTVSNAVKPNLSLPDSASMTTTRFNNAGDFSNVDYQLGLSYEASENTLLYANFATGYKSGGLNANALYQPEHLYSYEAGIRARPLDSLRLHFNAFYWDYRNHQEGNLLSVTGVGIAYTVTNIPKGYLYGAEVELDWKPTPNGLLSAQVAYNESDTGPFTITVVPSYTSTGQSYVKAPRWSANVAYSHIFAVGSMELEPRVSTRLSSSYNSNLFNNPAAYQSAFMKSDFSLTLRPEDKRWSLSAFVKNIEDTVVVSIANAKPSSTEYWGYLEDPRTFGVRANYNF